jgi:hypothetical protein
MIGTWVLAFRTCSKYVPMMLLPMLLPLEDLTLSWCVSVAVISRTLMFPPRKTSVFWVCCVTLLGSHRFCHIVVPHLMLLTLWIFCGCYRMSSLVVPLFSWIQASSLKFLSWNVRGLNNGARTSGTLSQFICLIWCVFKKPNCKTFPIRRSGMFCVLNLRIISCFNQLMAQEVACYWLPGTQSTICSICKCPNIITTQVLDHHNCIWASR